MTAWHLCTLETTESAWHHVGPCGEPKLNYWYIHAVKIHMHMLNDNKTNAVSFIFVVWTGGVPGKGSGGGLPEGGGPDGGPLPAPAEEELTPAVGGYAGPASTCPRLYHVNKSYKEYKISGLRLRQCMIWQTVLFSYCTGLGKLNETWWAFWCLFISLGCEK